GAAAMKPLDPRLHILRDDLADAALIGKVQAARFVHGEPACVRIPVARVRRRPGHDAPVDTEFLFGDTVRIFERSGGWAWIQGDFDGYAGYCEEDALGSQASEPTHVVAVPRTFLYPEPELK